MLAETLREWSREKKLALNLTAGVNVELGLAVLKVEQTKNRRRFPHGSFVQRTRGSRESHRGRRSRPRTARSSISATKRGGSTARASSSPNPRCADAGRAPPRSTTARTSTLQFNSPDILSMRVVPDVWRQPFPENEIPFILAGLAVHGGGEKDKAHERENPITTRLWKRLRRDAELLGTGLANGTHSPFCDARSIIRHDRAAGFAGGRVEQGGHVGDVENAEFVAAAAAPEDAPCALGMRHAQSGAG